MLDCFLISNNWDCQGNRSKSKLHVVKNSKLQYPEITCNNFTNGLKVPEAISHFLGSNKVKMKFFTRMG